MNSGMVPVSEGKIMKARTAKKLINKGATIMFAGEKFFAAKVVGKTVYFADSVASIFDVSVCTKYTADSSFGDKYTFTAVC